jgi:hypothetical protein
MHVITDLCKHVITAFPDKSMPVSVCLSVVCVVVSVVCCVCVCVCLCVVCVCTCV